MVLAFGDMFQLRPVQGQAPFGEPRNEQYAVTHQLEPRWDFLQVPNLIENHRQGEETLLREEHERMNKISINEKHNDRRRKN